MKQVIPREKIYRSLIYAILIALIIFVANYVVTSEGWFSPKTTYEKGEIADRTIVAPFDFYLYEDANILTQKQLEAAGNVLPRYEYSTDASFSTMKRLNRLFEIVEAGIEKNYANDIVIENLKKNGFNISNQELNRLKNDQVRTKIYEALMHNLEKIMQKGIYNNSIEAEKIVLLQDGDEIEMGSQQIFTQAQAGDYFVELLQNKEFFNNTINRQLAVQLLNNVIKDNIKFDKEATSRAKELAKASVPKIVGEVLKNELIVQKHQKISEDIYKKLQALNREKEERYSQTKNNENIFPVIGEFFYTILILFLYIPLFYLFKRKILIKSSLFYCVLILTFVNSFFAITVQAVDSLSVFLIPFGMSIILLCFLVGSITAVIFGIVNFLLFLTLLDWNFAYAFIISFSGLSAIAALTNPRNRRNFYVASFYNLVFFILFLFMMGAIENWAIIEILSNLQWGFAAVIISLLGSMVLLVPIEQRLPVVTNIHLQELGDFNNPLLKTLSEVASGTYHHSVIVGNLSETAAKSINANPILARVGSYYHDIGKTKDPEYFIENSNEKENIHNELSSTQSAEKVKQHVEDAVKLAQENRLPQLLVDIIRQHHGTSQISYFFMQAKANNEQINEEDFYYNGPKPQSKEAAIVMIADIVESTTKSLDSPDREQMEQVVQNTIANLIETEQLTESGISLQELKAIQKSIIPILFGIYQKRISYPK